MSGDETQRMDDDPMQRVDDDALAQTQWVASRARTQPATGTETPPAADERTQAVSRRPTQPIAGETTQRLPDDQTERMVGEQTERIVGDQTERMPQDRTERMDDERTERMPDGADAADTYVHFGPGVPIAIAPPPDRATAIWRGGLLEEAGAAGGGTVAATTARTPRSEGKRWILPLTVLIIVIAIVAYFLFGRSTNAVSLTGVSVRTSATTVGCSGQETLTGVVTTDGGGGDFTYQWLRSDGTKSEVLRQTVNSGTKVVDVTLVWNFDGIGKLHATAELDILGPGPARKASASFDYNCSG
jgi:hypothetical protein